MDDSINFDFEFNGLSQFGHVGTVNAEEMEVSDEEIIAVLTEMEAWEKNGRRPVSRPVVPAVPTAAEAPPNAAEIPSKKRRFATVSEKDLDKLASDRHEKKTVNSTAWAVRLMKGKYYLTYFFV